MEAIVNSLRAIQIGGTFTKYLSPTFFKHRYQGLSTFAPLLAQNVGNVKLEVNSNQSATQVFSHQQNISKKVVDVVNKIIEHKEEGRLFAVVQLCGKQFKVTHNDIIVVEGTWPPNIGDEIRLEKVLLVGSASFSVLGRPILPLNQVSIKATIIEKALAHTRVRFKYIRRKQYKRIHFVKTPQTFLRINSIDLLGRVDTEERTEDRIF